MRRSRSSSAVASSDRVRGSREGEITLLNAEPAVGSAPPSAGLSPAPSIRKKKMRGFAPVRTFCWGGVRLFPRPLLYGRGGDLPPCYLPPTMRDWAELLLSIFSSSPFTCFKGEAKTCRFRIGGGPLCHATA